MRFVVLQCIIALLTQRKTVQADTGVERREAVR